MPFLGKQPIADSDTVIQLINDKIDTRLSDGNLSNIVTTGYIRGPSTFTIDPAAYGDSTGTVRILGGLIVEGTTTTINSSTLTVDDLNITLADGAADAASADGAGITVSGANATLTYNSTPDAWSFNKDVGIGTTSNHAGARVVINDTPPTAFGSPMLQVGQETFTASGYYSIGLGYTAASYTEPPAEIAAVSTSSSGGTTADIIFGTRSVTTNTAVTERMRITSDGKIGIGESVPQSLLHLSANNPVITFTNTGGVVGEKGFRIAFDNSRLTFQRASDTGSFEANYLSINQDDGYVGIGTTEPQHQLDLGGNTPTLLLKDNRTGLGSGDILGRILFYNNEASTAGGARVTGSIKSVAYDQYGRTDLVFGTHTTDTKANFGDPGTYTDSTVERMRIDAYGNVGIGTSAPKSKLDLYGTSSPPTYTGIIRVAGGSATTQGGLEFINTSHSSGYGWRVDGPDEGSGETPIVFRVRSNTAAWTERVRLKPQGYFQFYPNGNGAGLRIGSEATGAMTSTYASISPSNGNIHYDTRDGGGYSHYFNWYGGTGAAAVFCGNGSSGYGTINASAFNVNSDYRVKTDVTTLTDAWDRVKQLSVKRFRYTEESLMPTDSIRDGFFAHEVAEIVPEAITGEKDAVKEDGTMDLQTIDQAKLVPLLAAALKEALERIEVLESA